MRETPLFQESKILTAENAVRFLEHQSRACRDRDAHEAFCLLLPAIVQALGLPPMEDCEAAAFHFKFKQQLSGKNGSYAK
jgi:hypothetical protein